MVVSMTLQRKENMASHIHLYDRVDRIPFDKLEMVFKKSLLIQINKGGNHNAWNFYLHKSYKIIFW